MLDDPASPRGGDDTRAPRWVKAFALAGLALLLLAVAMLVTGKGGEHGPGRHMTDAGSSAPVSTFVPDHGTPRSDH